METPTNSNRTHRVGTITCGAMLIIFGILFLLHLLFPAISYMFIFRLWPCILIALGIEILVANTKKYEVFKYDTAAVFLILVIACFALCMGGADFIMTHAVH